MIILVGLASVSYQEQVVPINFVPLLIVGSVRLLMGFSSKCELNEGVIFSLS